MSPITDLVSSYNLPLVALSILVAVFSASVALDISSRLKYAKNVSHLRWITAGAFILGLGIWSMHFIGMLAFHLPVEVSYHFGLVLLSIVPAVISCAIAFYLISKSSVTWRNLFTGAFFISAGIVSMHYLGMDAMRMDAMISYDPFMWALSALIAFAASFIGLALLFYIPNVPRFHWRKLAGAVLIGLAVSGMHYTGMAAADFSQMEHSAVGQSTPFSVNGTLLAYGIGGGMLMLFVLTLASVRTDRRLEMQSEESEMKFQSVIESAKDAIIVADYQGAIVQWNHGAETIFGYSKKEILGHNISVIVPDRFKEAHNKGMEVYRKTRKSKVIGNTIELTGCRKDGSEFQLEMSVGTWETEKGVFLSSILRDITERKASEDKINDLVYLDPLTGLPNRRLFNDRLDSLLRQADELGLNFSLFYMDLDNFKMINDRFGHSIGDLFLQSVASRLEAQITPKDTLSRLGGDEFILLLPNTEYNKAADRAQELIDALNAPFRFENEEIFTSVSVGISMFPFDGADSETLVKNADIAMYQAKEGGKNAFQFFTREMNETIDRKSKLATGLRKGLEHGEFTIHYQPQISLKTEQIIGVEALLRWNHPEWGMISPAEFIPIAEETGSITKIGEFVLEEACRQNKYWQDIGLAPFRVAVNISARQFAQRDLTEIVSTVLKKTGLAAQYLELELTETIIQNADSAITTMEELAALGVHLSIDDFGTGYSSLSYLKLFPIDSLKIDQHFTRNIKSDSKDAALVKTIIRMAHDLELNVIAEGVETEEQLEFLKSEQCNQAQGYYFNRPLPAQEIEDIYYTTKPA
ncbi:bifunctional diguanylate cyclase/phosphodiesterase [Planococcus maritimus]|uniref:bifunctional diguanylate cyclase/phosphodiesterase n=1 Tax=Planococcus maritimus TaxID=192421 RepID=UPI00232B141B|nr:bifunctional diguanylate cyclase/phosphodiesterase [Planococcus maritimus]